MLKMNFKEFIIELLRLASFDFGLGFILYLVWKYIDLKYFSTFDVETLKRENEYLRQENRKMNGTSTEFWNEEDMK